MADTIKQYAKGIKNLSYTDWRVIAEFHKVIMNYKKMKNLIIKHKDSL